MLWFQLASYLHTHTHTHAHAQNRKEPSLTAKGGINVCLWVVGLHWLQVVRKCVREREKKERGRECVSSQNT